MLARALLCLAIAATSPMAAQAKAKAPASRPAPSGVGASVMQAMACLKHDNQLRTVPARVGAATLPATLKAKTKLIAPLRASGSTEASAEAGPCAGVKPSDVVMGKDKGSVHEAVVLKAVQPIEVWRAFDDTPSTCGHAKLTGKWWSLSDPRKLGKAKYRRDNAICNSWNALSKVVRCTLKPGAVFAVGPSESASATTCGCPAKTRMDWGDRQNVPYAASDHYPPSPTLQVFINTRPFQSNLAAIMTCGAEMAWP